MQLDHKPVYAQIDQKRLQILQTYRKKQTLLFLQKRTDQCPAHFHVDNLIIKNENVQVKIKA